MGKLRPYTVVARGDNDRPRQKDVREAMEHFSFEVILYTTHFPFNEKVHNCAPSLSLQSQKCIEKPISGPHPDGSDLYGVIPE